MILDSPYYLIKEGALVFRYRPGGAVPQILKKDIQVPIDKIAQYGEFSSKSHIAWLTEDYVLYSYNDFGKGKMFYVEAII